MDRDRDRDRTAQPAYIRLDFAVQLGFQFNDAMHVAGVLLLQLLDVVLQRIVHSCKYTR